MEAADEFQATQKGAYVSKWLSEALSKLVFDCSFIQTVSKVSGLNRRREVFSAVSEAVKDLQAKILAATTSEDKLLLKFFGGFCFYRLCLISELDRQTTIDFYEPSPERFCYFANYLTHVETNFCSALAREKERFLKTVPAGCSERLIFVYDSFIKYQRGLLGLAALLKFCSERSEKGSLAETLLSDYDKLLQLCSDFTDEEEKNKSSAFVEEEVPHKKRPSFRCGCVYDTSDDVSQDEKEKKEEAIDLSPVSC